MIQFIKYVQQCYPRYLIINGKEVSIWSHFWWLKEWKTHFWKQSLSISSRILKICIITYCFTGNCCCQHHLESWFFWRAAIMASQWLSWACGVRGIWLSWRRHSKLRRKLRHCFKSHRMLARPGTRYYKQSIPWLYLQSLCLCSCLGCSSGIQWSPSNTETGVPKWSH